ncbi:MAG: L-threonylcarbamoyladenylate synthase [Planctomycetota bacterium]
MVPITPATADAIAEAASKLRDGQIVAVPTETVYGLAGDATNPDAIAAIYAAKGRPSNNPLIVHVDHVDAAMRCVDERQLDQRMREQLEVAKDFWPGPLTTVLPRASDLPNGLTAGSDSVAIRVPDHPVLLEVIRQSERPLAAPSANPSNYVSPTTAEHVAEAELPGLSMILDGGACRHGLESTIIRLGGESPELLRAGAIAAETLCDVFGGLVIEHEVQASDAVQASPGRMSKHYSPTKPLYFAADELPAGISPSRVARLSLAPLTRQQQSAFGWYAAMSETGELSQVAQNLFAMIRRADQSDCDVILIDPCPAIGLGRAIMDRIRRASHRSG